MTDRQTDRHDRGARAAAGVRLATASSPCGDGVGGRERRSYRAPWLQSDLNCDEMVCSGPQLLCKVQGAAALARDYDTKKVRGGRLPARGGTLISALSSQTAAVHRERVPPGASQLPAAVHSSKHVSECRGLGCKARVSVCADSGVLCHRQQRRRACLVVGGQLHLGLLDQLVHDLPTATQAD